MACWQQFVVTPVARRDFLHLEKWLRGRIAEHGLPFVAAIVQYIKLKTSDRLSQTTSFTIRDADGREVDVTDTSSLASVVGGEVVSTPQLSPESLAIFVNVLQSKLSMMPRSMADEVRQFRAIPSSPAAAAAAATSPPAPSAPNPTPSAGVTPPGMSTEREREAFPADIEEEANSYFQKIYTGGRDAFEGLARPHVLI